jgi:hypothetical protein
VVIQFSPTKLAACFGDTTGFSRWSFNFHLELAILFWRYHRALAGGYSIFTYKTGNLVLVIPPPSGGGVSVSTL